MEDRIEEAKKIINKNSACFLESIRSITNRNEFENSKRTGTNFEILCPGNSEFYQYSYYERTLIELIRGGLVNQSLKELFNLYGIEALWPDTNGKVYAGFSNDSIEEVIPFQFIIAETGYRYTSIYLSDEELDDLLTGYNLNTVVVIDWSIDKRQQNWHKDSRICYKKIEEVFTMFFTFDLYEYFINSLKQAVFHANNDIGFQTIPRLSLRYLSRFRAELAINLYEKDYTALRYRVLDKDDFSFLEYKSISLSENDYMICEENFKKRGLYKALIGTEGFAKCFITAEYLFNIFKDDNNFDYTSVISGYLKAVEQLVYKIVQINLLHSDEMDDCWIKAKKMPYKKKDVENIFRRNPDPKANSYQVRFDKKNEKYFDISLAPLIWFLYDNKRYEITDEGIEKIHNLLLRYSQECRNDHFHKDNIESFEEVKCIRNNTYLILYLLLGACSISNEINKDIEAFGVVNNEFDRIYRKIKGISKSVSEFVISFGENEIEVIRLLEQDEVIFDENGTLLSNSIKFVKKENYTDIEDEPSMTPDIIIDANHIPESMWFVKFGGERVLIEW